MDATSSAGVSDLSPPPAPRRRRIGLGKDFNLLWTAESVSLVGTEVTGLALPLTAVYVLHAGPIGVGLLGTATWLPYVLFALLAGAWGDRTRRRPVLIAADLSRAVLLGVIVILAITGMLTVPLLLTLAFLVGIGNVFFEVFYYSFVPSLVARDGLLGANSRLQASESTAQVGGPGLGGLLVQLLTAPVALLLDAASFLFSAFLLGRIRTTEPPPQASADQGRIVAQIRAGLRLTWHDRILLTLVATAAICNLTAQWITVLFPLLCIRELGLSAGAIGLVISTGAVGAVLGAWISTPVTRWLGVGKATVWTLFGECVGFLILPFAPARPSFAIPVLILGWFIVGLTAAVSRVVSISVRQTVTPHNFLGRVNATHRFISYGVVAIGTSAGGLIASVLGIRTAMAIAAVVMFASVGCVLVSPLLHIREIDTNAADQTRSPQEPPAAEATVEPVR